CLSMALVTLLIKSGSHRALSAGSHSLRYLVTMTVSGPGLRDSHVFIVAYMNYMQFMRFDSDGTTQRIQARGPWVKQMGPAYLEMERRKVESYSHRAQENLRFAIQVYNQSDNASHTFQCLIGCNMGPDRRLLRGHHRHAFDGSYYIILNSDQKTWTEADSTAQITQRQWKAEGVAEWLLRHLEIGKETLQTPPKVHVTHHPRSEGEVTLRCWALDCFPADVMLTWQRDEEDLTQVMDLVETRPAGDGTFQKWKYTCCVEHEGLPEHLTLRWEPPPPWPVVGITVGVVLLGVIIIGALIAIVMTRKKRAVHVYTRHSQQITMI
uniref:Ig-like domain-containing protein n=1 Tax=Mus spicilegus TaxID=10103 RepID=A0A8C6HAW4_MUSSI